MTGIAKQEVTGIILAGGRSRRMGVDKGLIEWMGKPMISYAIELLMPLCSRILISTSNPAYNSFGYPMVADIYPDKGPMGGLASCLEQSTTRVNICMPCDLPNMQRTIFDQLLKSCDGTQCVVPLTPQPEPLCAVYPSSVLSVMQQLIQEETYRMTEIFKRFPVKYIPSEAFEKGFEQAWFLNVNTPDDLV